MVNRVVVGLLVGGCLLVSTVHSQNGKGEPIFTSVDLYRQCTASDRIVCFAYIRGFSDGNRFLLHDEPIATISSTTHAVCEVRSSFAGREPMLHIETTGAVSRRNPSGKFTPATRLRVLAYRAPEQALAHADAPIWFLKMKGVAAQYVLRGTGLDLKRLGVTPADLERYGTCLLLDETRANGDRILVWTE